MPRRVKWLHFAKAQPILLPESLLPFWNGFYVPARRTDEFPDLELPDGRAYKMCDDFDFKKPRTDYDRVCALILSGGPARLIEVGPGYGLTVEDSAGGLGWWADESILIGGGSEFPPGRDPDGLEWVEAVRWKVPDARVTIMNSCFHGLEEVNEPRQQQVIELQPGTYAISAATHPKHPWVSYYHFRRVGRRRA